MMFLTLTRQVTSPIILNVEFPLQTWGPKQICEQNKLKITKFILISFLHVGTKHFHCIPFSKWNISHLFPTQCIPLLYLIIFSS